MRWFVDISSLTPGGDSSRFCVEAEQWQRALQSIRSLRGDTSPFSSFSIELLDEGYRAIDPTTRVRFTVQKAPDDAEIVLPNGASTSKPPTALTKSDAPRSQSRRGRTGVSIPADPVPRIISDKPPTPAPLSTTPQTTTPQSVTPQSATPQSTPHVVAPVSTPPRPGSSAPPGSAPPGSAPPSNAPPASNGSPSVAPADLKPSASRPMQAETAFEKMTQGLSFPLSSQTRVVVSEASTQILPPFTIQSERDQKPTAEAPLTYREMVLVVDEKTSLADAEAIARGQYEVIRASLAGGPKGIFITVAVFDHAFDKKPARLPLTTLSFKDWRDKEPQLFFPLRDGPPVRASMAPPTAKVPSEARPTALPPTTPSATPAAEPALKATTVIPVPPAASAPPAPAPPAPAPPAPAPQTESPVSIAPSPSSAPPAAPTQASSGTPAAPPATHPPAAIPPPPPSAPESLTTVMDQPVDSDLEFGPDTIGTPPRVHEDEPKTDAPTPVFLGAASSVPAPSIRVVAGAGVSSVPPAEPIAATEAAAPEAMPEPTPGSDAETQPIQVAPSQPPPAMPTTLTGTALMPASQPPPAPSQPPPASVSTKKRVRGDDLIAELFEALSDLEFLSDPLEGAEFVLATALEKIPCEAGMVSFFSLDKQEFVVVRAAGSVPRGALLTRASEKAGLLTRAMRMNQTLIVSGTPVHELEDDPRWKATGLSIHCVACVPINFGGRYLGVLEIANPTDGIPLAAADGHALTYIGQQFAEFLSKRELVLDADRVLAPRVRAAK